MDTKTKQAMRFAIIDSYSGFVMGVVDAASAADACAAVDAEAGNGRHDGKYIEVDASELLTTRCLYDVRVAPAGFGVDDGQDPDQIATVDALPRVGVYARMQKW
jgi:hypothetical protein